MAPSVTMAELYQALEKEPRLLFELACKIHSTDLKILGPWMKTIATIYARGDVEGDTRFLIARQTDGSWQCLVSREPGRPHRPMGRYSSLEVAQEHLDTTLRNMGWTLL